MADRLDLDAALESISKISEAVKQFEDPELRQRAFDLLAATTFTYVEKPAPHNHETQDEPAHETPSPEEVGAPSAPAKKSAAKKAGKRPAKKASYDIPKNVNYAPEGSQSLRDFADEKKPTSNTERALVAAHYLSSVLDRKVNVGEIVAIFRYLDWQNPADPFNNLQKAQTEGWLDVATNKEDIKVVFAGEEYIRTRLPKPVKSK